MAFTQQSVQSLGVSFCKWPPATALPFRLSSSTLSLLMAHTRIYRQGQLYIHNPCEAVPKEGNIILTPQNQDRSSPLRINLSQKPEEGVIGQRPLFQAFLPRASWTPKAWMTLIVLWAFILRTRKLLEVPWRLQGSGGTYKTGRIRPQWPPDPAPKENSQTSCSPTETPCSTTSPVPDESPKP